MTPAQLSQQLQCRFDVLVSFREYQIRRPCPCRIAAVDELLGGGFPRGAVSEISGNQSSNRTALTVSILVQVFDAGECCAWLDAGGTFDPESSAEAGLRPEQLFWINGLRPFIPLIDVTPRHHLLRISGSFRG